MSVEVLAILNRRDRPVLTVYEGKTQSEVALFKEDGNGLFVCDDTLEFNENDFVTVGFKDAARDGNWMKWILVVDRIAAAYPDPYEVINGKIDMIISGSDVEKRVVSINCPSSAQQWIRKSTKSEIDLLKSTVIYSGSKEQIDVMNKVLARITTVTSKGNEDLYMTTNKPKEK